MGFSAVGAGNVHNNNTYCKRYAHPAEANECLGDLRLRGQEANERLAYRHCVPTVWYVPFFVIHEFLQNSMP